MSLNEAELKVTEATIQAVLMNWAMEEKHHQIVLPNSNQFFNWECDLLSITQASFVHEYEVKLNRADYKRDATKRKHHWIGNADRAPAYFWYATYEFEIEPPEKAGWLYVWYDKTRHRWVVDVKKDAPRLNKWKVDDRMRMHMAHLLSYRIKSYYRQYMYMRKESL